MEACTETMWENSYRVCPLTLEDHSEILQAEKGIIAHQAEEFENCDQSDIWKIGIGSSEGRKELKR